MQKNQLAGPVLRSQAVVAGAAAGAGVFAFSGQGAGCKLLVFGDTVPVLLQMGLLTLVYFLQFGDMVPLPFDFATWNLCRW